MVYIYEYEKIVYPKILGDIGLNCVATASSGRPDRFRLSAAHKRVRTLV